MFGNVGSIAAFRVGPEDAEFLEKQFAPTFAATDLMNIENRNAYVRMLAHGTPLPPFSVHTMAPQEADAEKVERLKKRSRERYGVPRAEIEADIEARYVAPLKKEITVTSLD